MTDISKIEQARQKTIRAINKRRGYFYCNHKVKYHGCNQGMSLAIALIESYTMHFDTPIEAIEGWREVIKHELKRNWGAHQEGYREINRGLIEAKKAVRTLIEFVRACRKGEGR